MNPIKRIKKEEGETRYELGVVSYMSGEINWWYWFSQYDPPHPLYGGWAFWKCCSWAGSKPLPSCYDEIKKLGFDNTYQKLFND